MTSQPLHPVPTSLRPLPHIPLLPAKSSNPPFSSLPSPLGKSMNNVNVRLLYQCLCVFLSMSCCVCGFFFPFFFFFYRIWSLFLWLNLILCFGGRELMQKLSKESATFFVLIFSVDIPDHLLFILLLLPPNFCSLRPQWQKTFVEALSSTLKGAFGAK